MNWHAGTSRGVFAIGNGSAELRLEARGVRELVRIGTDLFAGTSAGLFRSTDDGADWHCVAVPERAVWQVRAASDGTLYAGTQPAGLLRSHDGGASWHEVPSFAAMPEAADWCVPVEPRQPGAARAIVIDPADPDRIRVGIEVGGVACSDDGGRSWRMVLPGDNPDLHMMCVHPGRPGTLFASTGYGRLDGVAEMIEGNAGVFRSEDGGRSWTYAWHGITPRYSRPMCIDARPPHPLTVASAPTAFSSVRDAEGAGAMLLRSDDDGRSWHSLCDAGHSPSRANFHGLMPDPAIPGGVVVGTDSGEVWRVTPDARWTRIADGLPAVLSLAA